VKQTVTGAKADPTLQANIWRTWRSDLPWKSWRDAEHDVHSALKDELRRCKVESFQSWRSHMAKEGREVTNWLKQKHFRVAPLISDAEGPATTASQSVSKLLSFGTADTQRNPQTAENQRLQAELDAGCFRNPQQHALHVP
jgi:hypothetical protein